MAQFSEIWIFIEEKMRMKIPSYIKHILEHCGYDNFYSVASIEETDFDYFTNEVREGRICPEKAFANSAGTTADFEFTRGHQRLIMEFVKFVKTILDTSGIDGLPIMISNSKTKMNTKNVNSILRKHEHFSLSAISPTTEINREIDLENNSTTKKVEGCLDIKEDDSKVDSFALMQSDSKKMQETSSQMANANVLFPRYNFGFCFSHALSQVLNVSTKLLDQVQIRKLDVIGSVTSLTTTEPNVSTSTAYKEVLDRETNEIFNFLCTPQAEDYVIYAASKENLPKWPENTPTIKYFVAKTLSVNDEMEDAIKLKHLKKSRYSKFKFIHPEANDVREVARIDIIKVLEAPSTNRRSELVFNDISLLNYNFDNESYKIIQEHTDIWSFIENKMKLDIPPSIKRVLIACGYDNCHTIGTIEEDDVNYFTDEVRKGKVSDISEREGQIFEHFEFNRGQKKLIVAIANFVKKTLEVDGIDGFSLKTPKRKLDLNHKMTYVPRKKVKNTSSEQVDVDIQDEDPSKVHRSNLLRHVVKQLITDTGELFSENFEKMITDKPSHEIIQFCIDLPNDTASVQCPYCGKPSSVSYSYKDTPNSAPWWNMSNFHRHLMNIHRTDTECHSKKRQTRIVKSVIPKSNEQMVIEEQSTPITDGTQKIISNWGNFGIVLQNFVNSSERNVDRKKAGYRFDPVTKAFAAYIFMLAGPLAFETLNANLPFTIPSTSTVHRYLADNGPRIIEGEMRTEELLLYLKKRNLPLVVSLCEDATRITAKISYDPNTNQLIGFALPLDKNGMPIILSFPARSVTEIRNHFSNPSNNISSSLYIQMAKPLDRNVPPFCLMMFLTDNTFKADKVYKRWIFQADQLKDKGVKIHNVASDGDSRPLKAMKHLSRIGQPNNSYFDCEWFSCGTFAETTFTQDLFHILTKLRNLLLKCSRIIPIGNKIVSSTHLKYLMENVSKDKHKLTRYDIEPKDRQNVTSAEKICTENVMECLSKYVPGSEGTIIFLRAMRYACEAFSESNMKSSERIYCMWYTVFFFRAWRSWIIQSEKVKNSGAKTKAKKCKHVYTLKENFISSNCYSCIELNAHALVKQLLVEDAQHGTQKIFFPDLYASQPCEKIFRQVRSFTSTFSTVVNFNMLDVIHRIRKVQLQSDIIAEWKDSIKFPRFEKKLSVNDCSNKLEGLNRESIKIEIERARNAVIHDLSNFDIDASKLIYHCQVKPVIDIDDEGDSDNDVDSDVGDFDFINDFFEDEERESSYEQNELESLDLADENCLSGITGDLMLRDYNINMDIEDGKQDGISLNETSPYVVVRSNSGNEMVVRKSSICWLLSKDKFKLSSDRLVRVQEKDYLKGHITSTGSAIIPDDRYVVCDQITIGEWCIFFDKKDDEEAGTKILVGLVLGFTYLDGETFKKREFSKTFASIPSAVTTHDRAVGVLCTFYTFDDNGVLSTPSGRIHSFVNIANYGGTIKSPLYLDNSLTISQALLVEIEKLLTSYNHTD